MKPFFLDQGKKAVDSAVVRVEHDRGQGACLGRSVPTVAAVDQHGTVFDADSLDKRRKIHLKQGNVRKAEARPGQWRRKRGSRRGVGRTLSTGASRELRHKRKTAASSAFTAQTLYVETQRKRTVLVRYWVHLRCVVDCYCSCVTFKRWTRTWLQANAKNKVVVEQFARKTKPQLLLHLRGEHASFCLIINFFLNKPFFSSSNFSLKLFLSLNFFLSVVHTKKRRPIVHTKNVISPVITTRFQWPTLLCITSYSRLRMC